MLMKPASGLRMPAMRLSRVVLPEPLSPLESHLRLIRNAEGFDIHDFVGFAVGRNEAFLEIGDFEERHGIEDERQGRWSVVSAGALEPEAPLEVTLARSSSICFWMSAGYGETGLTRSSHWMAVG